MSSGSDEPVADGGGKGHSVFAASFINALQEAEMSVFTAAEIFHTRVKSSVAGKSEQLPQYNIISPS
jgi:hypothetical protein